MPKTILSIDSSTNLLVNLWVWIVLGILPYQFHKGKGADLTGEGQSDISIRLGIYPYNSTNLLDI